jgi:nucleotide-binding universal stress UspA family protein
MNDTPSAGSPAPHRTFLVVVDDTEEMQVALKYASRRARATGGRVILLYVIQPAEFQHWAGVGRIMQDESRQDAERRVAELSEIVNRISGKIPVVHLREGNRRDELLKLVAEDPSISVLVLAAGTGSEGPGPLVSFLVGKASGKVRVPITIVPGHLSDDQLEAVT